MRKVERDTILRCPVTGKVSYGSRDEALAAGAKYDQGLYLCACDSWHCTSRTPSVRATPKQEFESRAAFRVSVRDGESGE